MVAADGVRSEWHETVFVVGKRLEAGTFHDGNDCRAFDKNGCRWAVDRRSYDTLKLPDDPCEWDQVRCTLLPIRNRVV